MDPKVRELAVVPRVSRKPPPHTNLLSGLPVSSLPRDRGGARARDHRHAHEDLTRRLARLAATPRCAVDILRRKAGWTGEGPPTRASPGLECPGRSPMARNRARHHTRRGGRSAAALQVRSPPCFPWGRRRCEALPPRPLPGRRALGTLSSWVASTAAATVSPTTAIVATASVVAQQLSKIATRSVRRLKTLLAWSFTRRNRPVARMAASVPSCGAT
jgi:hypothetical protein